MARVRSQPRRRGLRPSQRADSSRRHVHFWTERDVTGLSAWDPDADPGEYADGTGHALFELYARCRSSGDPVSIGAEVPANAAIVVATMRDLTGWTSHVLPGPSTRLAGITRRVGQAIVIRGDIPLDVSAPPYFGTEIVPSPRTAASPRQVFVPLLPQRGMTPRDPSRGSRISTMAIKCGEENLPRYLDDEFEQRLSAVGVRIRRDVTPASWTDFGSVDLVLCDRHHGEHDDELMLRKPPTKLINSWAAGSIPLVAPEASMMDLIREGTDAEVVRSADDVVRVVSELTADASRCSELFASVSQRRAEYESSAVLEQWRDLFQRGEHEVPRWANRRYLAERSVGRIMAGARRVIRRR